MSRRSRMLVHGDPEVTVEMPVGVNPDDISRPCMRGLRIAAHGGARPDRIVREHETCRGIVRYLTSTGYATKPCKCWACHPYQVRPGQPKPTENTAP